MTMPDAPFAPDAVAPAMPPPLPPLDAPAPVTSAGDSPIGGYNPRTPWTAWWGMGAVLIIGLVWMLFLIVVGAIGVALYPDAVQATAGGMMKPRLDQPGVAYGFAAIMLASQIFVAALTILFARLRGGTLGGVLALRRPSSGGLSYAWAVPLFVTFGFSVGLLAQWLWPQSNQADTEMMMMLARSPASWLIFLVAVVGAPLQEELIFRGFLFSALARVRWIGLACVPAVVAPILALIGGLGKVEVAEIGAAGLVASLVIYGAGLLSDKYLGLNLGNWTGFIGTALFTSACWAAIHGYSGPGDVTIFCLGLMLSFILWRTGSTRVTMACHGTYNAMAFLLAALASPGSGT